MQSTTQISAKITTWKKPSEFKTQADFLKYFSKLPLETKEEMSNANIPAAQRALAAEYCEKEDMPNFHKWTDKAADLGDPVSLLMKAQISCLETEKAKEYVKKALTTIQDSKDEDFRAFVKQIADENLKIIARVEAKNHFDFGVKKHEQKDFQGAIDCWQQAVASDDPSASYNIAKLAFDHKKMNETVYYADLTLHIAEKSKNCNNYRASAHNLLGVIETNSLDNESSYTKLLSAISHFRKAKAYNNEGNFDNNIAQLLSLVDDNSVRASLMNDSTPIAFKNGTYKTCHEIYSRPHMTTEEFDLFLTYPDPRKRKPMPALIINSEEKPLVGNTKEQTSSSSTVSSMGQFSDQNQKSGATTLKEEMPEPKKPKQHQ